MKTVGEATHYHTQWVVPYWSPSLIKLTQVGAHIFYRWTGASGQPPAFAGRYLGSEPGAEAPKIVQLTPPQTLVTASAVLAEREPTSDRTGSLSVKAASPEPKLVITRNDPPPLVQAPPAVVTVTPPPTNYFGPPRSRASS